MQVFNFDDDDYAKSSLGQSGDYSVEFFLDYAVSQSINYLSLIHI